MRVGIALTLGLLGIGALLTYVADDGETGMRHGVRLDLKTYPQTTPKETLASVLKAIDDKRFDYLLAQLADPTFVDEHVKRYSGGHFEEQVEESRARLDAGAVKLLHRFLADGDWPAGADEVCVRLKDVSDRCLYLRKIGARWFLEHRYKPDAKM